MERNVDKLFQRYKKSQDLLDNVNIQGASQPAPHYPLQEYSSHFQSRLKLNSLKHMDEQSESSSREKKRTKKSYHQSGEQISRLRDTMYMKENMDRERTDKIGYVNQELTMQLKEALHGLKESERKCHQKDDILRQYEDELRVQQDAVMQYQQHMREHKLKEEGSNRLVEEIKQSHQQQRSKMAKKKAKLTHIKLLFKQLEQQSQQQAQQFNVELESVQQLCEDFSNEIKQQEARNAELEQELLRVNEVSHQKDSIIRQCVNDNMNSDLELGMQGFSVREQENLHQVEGEQARANDFKIRLDACEMHLNESKQEITQAVSYRNTEVQRCEEEMRRMSHHYESELERKKQKIVDMKHTLESRVEAERARRDTDEQSIKVSHEAKKSLEVMVRDCEQKYLKTQMELEGERSHSLMKVSVLSEEKANQARQIEELDEHIAQLRDSYSQLQAHSTNMERQLLDEKYEYNESMNDIELRIDQLVTQLTTTQAENQSLKARQTDHKKQDEQQLNKLRSKLEKSKTSCELLRQQLKQAEDKLRSQDSHQAQQELNKVRSSQNLAEQQVKTKLKVIDDIQAMIQSHKQHSLHF